MKRMEGNRKGSNGELRRPSEDCRENRPAGFAGCSKKHLGDLEVVVGYSELCEEAGGAGSLCM